MVAIQSFLSILRDKEAAYMKNNRSLPALILLLCAFLLSASCAVSETFTLPANTKAIAGHAFENCTNFDGTLTIPAGVETIGEYAFSGCSGFTGVPVIPSTVTSIGAYAFRGCTGFSGTLYLSPTIQLDPLAFEGCSEALSVVYARVALVIDSPETEDGGFHQASHAAASAFCQAKSLDYQVFGAEDSNQNGEIDEQDLLAAAKSAIDQKYNVLILPGFSFGGIISSLQEQNPGVCFIGLDITKDDFGSAEIGSNVYLASYHEEQAGFLAGYAAVKLGYKHIGFLGGMATPAVKRYGYGYIQGADAAAERGSGVTLEYLYANRFWPEPIIKTYMDRVYGKDGGALGVEVVFACGGGIWGSVGASASAFPGAKIIGVDADQAELIDGTFSAPGFTVTSAMKNLGSTIRRALTAVTEGSWSSLGGKAEQLGIVSADPAENHVGIPDSTQFSSSFSKEDYLALVAKIHSGEIVVSGSTEAMPRPANITVYDLGTIGTLDYRIAILTGSKAQGAEEFDAADQIAEAHPYDVLHDIYPERFNEEEERAVTIRKLKAFARDPFVRAILSVQAVDGVTEAFANIRSSRDDILLIAGVPQEELGPLSAVSDFILDTDGIQAGIQVANLAHQWGCDVLVHFSFARHMSMEGIVAKHDVMKITAEGHSIEFADEVCPDPVADEGMEYAVNWILTNVPEIMQQYPGKKVCFYFTNCGLQAPLQKAVADQQNAYYALPCCPSPYHGFQDAFGLTASYDDPEGALKGIAAYLKEKDAVGRFSTWALPVNMTMIRGSFQYACLSAEGKTDGKADQAKFVACYAAAAGTGVHIEADQDTENYLLVALQPVDFADYLD